MTGVEGAEVGVMIRRRGMLWIAVVALLAGCAVARPPSGSDELSGAYLGWLHQHARDVLDRFDKAVRDAGGSPRLIALGDLYELDGGGWTGVDANTKRAFLAGLIVPATVLPKAPHPTGKVVWDNGETLTMPLISADAALKQLAAEGTGTCPGCTPIEATGATFGVIGWIRTTYGTATLPAWQFTFKNMQTVAWPAISVSSIVRVDPMPWDYDSPVRIDSATTAVASRQLTVNFIGSKGPASQVCGVDYTAEAIESDYAVAVIVIAHAHPRGDYACTMIGYDRTATVDLARPLGDRAVLQTQQGLPVPVTITK